MSPLDTNWWQTKHVQKKMKLTKKGRNKSKLIGVKNNYLW